MRLLDRYLLRELLVPLGYCLAGFLMFWIPFDLFNELNGFQEKKLQPADIKRRMKSRMSYGIFYAASLSARGP